MFVCMYLRECLMFSEMCLDGANDFECGLMVEEEEEEDDDEGDEDDEVRK